MLAPKLIFETEATTYRQTMSQQSRRPYIIVTLGSLAVLVLVVVLIALSSLDKSDTSQPSTVRSSSESGPKTLRATYWCGESFDDAGQIGLSVSRGDTTAIAGMIARGVAFQVEKDTEVTGGAKSDMGISLVHIDSGFQAGRKCYIATNALK